MKKRIFAAVMAICIGIGMTGTVYASDTNSSSNQNQEEINDLKQQLAALQAQLDEYESANGGEDTGTTSGAESSATTTAKSSSSKTGAEGYKLVLNEAVGSSDWGAVSVTYSGFDDTVQAVNAAEDSAVYKADQGKKYYHARFIFKSVQYSEATKGNAFTAALVVDGTTLTDGKLMAEAQAMDGTNALTAKPEELSQDAYLFDVTGSTQPTYQFYGTDLYYSQYDYLIELPVDTIKSASDMYLQLNVNDSKAYLPVDNSNV